MDDTSSQDRLRCAVVARVLSNLQISGEMRACIAGSRIREAEFGALQGCIGRGQAGG